MRLPRHSIAFCLLLCAYFLFHCSTSGGDDIAGGTGTGNPSGGGATTVAVIADTASDSADLSKVRSAGNDPLQIELPIVPPIGPFSMVDEGDLAFTVDSATVTAAALYFILQDQSVCDTTFVSSLGHVCDSGRVVVQGPFTFNLLTGQSTPSIDTLTLPAANYSGFGLLLETKNAVSPVHVAGTFVENDTTHRFDIFVDANSMETYHRSEGSVSVTSDSLTQFILKLKTHDWLASLDIGSCIRNGNIPLGANGELVIDFSSGAGPCVGVHAQIRANILNSGKLETLSRVQSSQ